MNSSTSASDPVLDAEWGRWLAVCLWVVVAGTAAVYGAIVLLDPYSTGRFTPIQRVDIVTDQTYFATAARVRDPNFNSAVIGNSHVMVMAPERLTASTGRRFVDLALAGLWPNEQAFIARSFVRHHPGQVILLVWGIDDQWCNSDLEARIAGSPLPFWLYESSDFTYLSHILSPDALREAVHRAMILLSLAAQAGPADGRNMIDLRRSEAVGAAELAATEPATSGEPADAPMPGIDFLANVLSHLEPDVRVVLEMPPVFAKMLPIPDSAAGRRSDACKARLRALANLRRRTTFLDLRIDTPLTRDAKNFFDQTHYKDSVAQFAEAQIADAVATLEHGPGTH
jgi:hypothetical protein